MCSSGRLKCLRCHSTFMAQAMSCMLLWAICSIPVLLEAAAMYHVSCVGNFGAHMQIKSLKDQPLHSRMTEAGNGTESTRQHKADKLPNRTVWRAGCKEPHCMCETSITVHVHCMVGRCTLVRHKCRAAKQDRRFSMGSSRLMLRGRACCWVTAAAQGCSALLFEAAFARAAWADENQMRSLPSMRA